MRTAALALAAALAAGCRRSGPRLLLQPRQTLDGFSLSQSYRSQPSWDLHSPHAELPEQSQQAVLESPKLQFYKAGKLASVLTASYGTVGMKDYDVALSTRVVATSLEDGSTLETEELRYSNQRKKFFTEKDVLVKKPAGVLRGRGLEATPDLSEIRIFKQRSEISKAPGK